MTRRVPEAGRVSPLFVSVEAAEYLDQLHELGVRQQPAKAGRGATCATGPSSGRKPVPDRQVVSA
jgi:hypothetical protein